MTTPNPDPTGSSAASEKKPSRVRVRAWHIVFLIVVVIITCLLAYWQWTRFTSGTGSLQNLGYALQWPMFGAFAVFAYRQGIKMENQHLARLNADGAGSAGTQKASAKTTPKVSSAAMEALYAEDAAKYGDPDAEEPMTRISDDFLPSRPTMNVEEFNAANTPRRRAGEHDERI